MKHIKQSSTKISVIITVFNEENSIALLLSALNKQSLAPDEVCIVDAGSSDDTTSIIQTMIKTKSSFSIKLKIIPGCNRSIGRNQAIKLATGNIIAVTDAGCIPYHTWLERLTKPLRDDKSLVVAGFYSVKPKSRWQAIFAWYLATMPENVASDFLPSSRSIAFLKRIHHQVGGYPEHLSTCEDLIFAKRLQEETKIDIIKDALVEWELPINLNKFFIQVSNYALGDIQARYKPHLHTIYRVILRYCFFLIFPPLWIIYLALFPLFKFRRRIVSIDQLLRSSIVQAICDFALLWAVIKSVKNFKHN